LYANKAFVQRGFTLNSTNKCGDYLLIVVE